MGFLSTHGKTLKADSLSAISFEVPISPELLAVIDEAIADACKKESGRRRSLHAEVLYDALRKPRF